MVRDLPALEVDLLRQVLDCLLRIEQRLVPPVLKPESELLQAILGYTGSLALFTAGELVEADDALLRAALGDRNAFMLGHELSDLEGAQVSGRRLVFKGKGVDGNRWAFEPA